MLDSIMYVNECRVYIIWTDREPTKVTSMSGQALERALELLGHPVEGEITQKVAV